MIWFSFRWYCVTNGSGMESGHIKLYPAYKELIEKWWQIPAFSQIFCYGDRFRQSYSVYWTQSVNSANGSFLIMTSSNGNIFRVTGHLCREFTAQRPVTWSFDVFCDLRLNNDLINNREAGDLRRYRAHYGVILILLEVVKSTVSNEQLIIQWLWLTFTYSDKHILIEKILSLPKYVEGLMKMGFGIKSIAFALLCHRLLYA